MKKQLKKLLRWALSSEIESLDEKKKDLKDLEQSIRRDYAARAYKMEEQMCRIKELLNGIECGVDVHSGPHHRANSWAVISLQGKRSDFIKFVDLADSDIRAIARFLDQFDRAKIDATPQATQFLRIERKGKGLDL